MSVQFQGVSVECVFYREIKGQAGELALSSHIFCFDCGAVHV